MQAKTEGVCRSVLKRISPSKKERNRITALAKKLERNVVSACKTFKVDADVRLEGSVAKDTWINGEPDIDIFMQVSPKIPRESLGKVCLKVAKEATKGFEQIERFAEHPYLEAIVDGTRVNIVPCYAAKRGKWLSATDRTPFHTDYIRKHLDERLRDEVRLLKKFMKGIEVYGAEIKVGGFSGYLCELLVLRFGSFAAALQAFAQRSQRIIIDIEEYYRNRESELRLLFNEPLVVVDPVDKARNVASAVLPQKLCTFVAASRAFLKSPNTSFFYPPEIAALSPDALIRKITHRGPVIVVVVFGKVDAVPDVSWGQLYKSQRSLRKLVQLNDFEILRDIAWSDEESLSMFIFELEDCCIPPVKKHLGPPLEKEHECDRFLAKHQSSPSAVAGPYIEYGRWVVQIRRKYVDACVLLREGLKDGGRKAGVAGKISQVLRQGFQVLVNEEIAEICRKNREFAEFLTEFLSGKAKWLEAAQA